MKKMRNKGEKEKQELIRARGETERNRTDLTGNINKTKQNHIFLIK